MQKSLSIFPFQSIFLTALTNSGKCLRINPKLTDILVSLTLNIIFMETYGKELCTSFCIDPREFSGL